MLFRVFWLLFLSSITSTYGQDTVFVNKHNFPTPVRNVFKAIDGIYAKTGDGVFRFSNNRWEIVHEKFNKPFLFYDNDFFEADYIPDAYKFNPELMRKLIPQDALTNPSIAILGTHFFIAIGGSLYEYQVNPFYSHSYKSYSIRDIYLEDSLKVISSYSGIFINDSIKANQPTYSSGSMVNINGKYFLCSDELFSFNPPNHFEKIDVGSYNRVGHIRKLIVSRDTLYSQHTLSINRLDSLNGITAIHQGFEYYDLEIIDNTLLFCTNTGEVFRYSNRKVSQLFDINIRIRDIYHLRGITYFSADDGVYTITGWNAETLKKYLNLPLSIGVVSDVQNNLWISTENGLYLLPKGAEVPISFIPSVEFNRGALTYHGDKIYAGSIDGLYTIDVFKVERDFLPLHTNKKSLSDNTFLILLIVGIVTLVVVGFAIYYFRFRKVSIPVNGSAKKMISLEQINEDILNNNIMSVEGLAEFYKTNTVQLNRIFKSFDTTPGKFLKQAKLELAKELLQNKTPMDEVSNRTGYSGAYIRKNL